MARDIERLAGGESGGTENYLKRTHRDRLPLGYPDDLAADSTPETGSIGVAGMPITNRKAPFTLKGDR